MKTPEEVATDGLLQGYASGIKPPKVSRGGFTFKVSHIETPDGIYHDEWINGSGGEITRVENQLFSRVYAGKFVSEETLKKHGITEEEASQYHMRKVTEAGGKTRLRENYKPEPDGDWQFSYEIIREIPEVDTWAGQESIHYKGDLIFGHIFVMCSGGHDYS